MVLLSGFVIPALANPGDGILFGTDASGSNLLNVNPNTGAAIIIGNMGIGASPSLAVDPTTGIMYAGNGGGSPLVFTVNPGDGSTVLLGDSGIGFAAIGGMDFDSSGTLYAAVNIAGDGGTGSDHLAIIDKTNGLATIVGPFGICVGVPPLPVDGSGLCDIEGMEGIAFAADGTLYGTHSARGAAGAPGLYTINPGTGTAAFVAPILDVAGAPASGGIVSIQFGCDGTLYGGTARDQGPPDGGFLVTINPGTGQFAFVGAASATGANSLAALAFENNCIVGGELLPINTTALLVAGAQTNAVWIMSALAVIGSVAFGALYITSKKSENS